MILHALAAFLSDFSVGLLLAVVLGVLAGLLVGLGGLLERRRTREPLPPGFDYRAALRVMDRTRRGPCAEEHLGKTRVGL